MSDTDDTDVLVLIPPDLFIVQSSDSDDSSDHTGKFTDCSVVSVLLKQVYSLEDRIKVIESKDYGESNKNEKLTKLVKRKGQTLPRTKHSVSSKSRLDNFCPKFHQSFSLLFVLTYLYQP